MPRPASKQKGHALRKPTPPGTGEFAPGEPRRSTAPRYSASTKTAKFKRRSK